MRSVGFAVALLLVVAVAGVALAVEEKAPTAKVKVRGIVAVVKNDAGVVTAVSIKTPKRGDKEATETKVVLDEQGKKLAELDGKQVVAVGTMTEAKELKVESFEELKPKPKTTP